MVWNVTMNKMQLETLEPTKKLIKCWNWETFLLVFYNYILISCLGTEENNCCNFERCCHQILNENIIFTFSIWCFFVLFPIRGLNVSHSVYFLQNFFLFWKQGCKHKHVVYEAVPIGLGSRWHSRLISECLHANKVSPHRSRSQWCCSSW